MKYSEARTEKTKQFIYKIQYEIQKGRIGLSGLRGKRRKEKLTKINLGQSIYKIMNRQLK